MKYTLFKKGENENFYEEMQPSLSSQLASLKFKKVVEEHLESTTYKGFLGEWGEELFPETTFAVIARIEGTMFFENGNRAIRWGDNNSIYFAAVEDENTGKIKNTIILPVTSEDLNNKKETLIYTVNGYTKFTRLFPMQLFTINKSYGAKYNCVLSLFAFYI